MNGRVLVIGLGLIGGSLALCLKKEHSQASIIGYDIRLKDAQLAKTIGVIDDYCESIQSEAILADLIVIATPVNQAEKIIDLLYSLPLKPEVIITDTGSTKGKISLKASKLIDNGIHFIGGNPMAGSHKSGFTAAKEILFENAFYLITPDNRVPEDKTNILKEWLKGTKAKFLTVTPASHDFITGIVSHFPHLIAASLVHQAEKFSAEEMLIPRLAAGGFRDITRIASSSPEMWRDILLHNRDVLLSLLEHWNDEMSQIRNMILHEDAEGILGYFTGAKQFRDGLPSKEKGAIPAFYDLFVDVPDYPGIISEITGYLAKENISITNIRILETREEIYGVLVISFQTEDDRKRAEGCIASYSNYPTSYGS
ncbi:prephenate dehydrogenase [Neobacillus sp. PS3-34]|uniref:prephenate dehydrogenase n=1 Tax=Neobacillus sp. PS3-34 TaxID=3070678 RepID=UPI0027E0BC03|nr:prephenate dehydrogenase [Neobacillus sp. PS3-34]WML47700.1 prephenate dehydrogenase [Neobacillus sp. PS3-34]